MDSPITLAADNVEDLNKLIDSKLKEGYLIQGGMFTAESGGLNQIMVLPNNIDSEFTLAGAIKLAIILPLWATLVYFLI